MLRCRRCRKGVVDSSCLSTVEAAGDSSAAVCSIWHVDADALPEWMLTVVHQAQWTVGKLNCQSCAARLGGFNFIKRGECPCGRDAAVHLSKSRVDRDHKHYVLIVQPRRTRPEKGRDVLPTDGSHGKEQRSKFNRSALDAFQLNCAALTSHGSPAVDRENTQAFSFSPLYCIAHGRRRSREDDAAIWSSCLCPAGPTDEFTRPTSRLFDDEAPGDAAVRHSCVPGRTRLPLDRRLPRTAGDVASSPETAAVHEAYSESALFHRGSSISGGVAEQDQATALMASPPASNRLSKRERNRLKSARRKQRRRERWLHCQLEQAESMSASLLDGDEEEEEEEEDREGLTCAVCLDVYLRPYSCHPCGHVFCEPCLRTIARNRPANTPCPLCRTLISHTNLHTELNRTAQTFFPNVYDARRQNFQSASCSKWPLPCCPKRFRTFWGEKVFVIVALAYVFFFCLQGVIFF